MNPDPLSSLNHFTVPVAILIPPGYVLRNAEGAEATAARDADTLYRPDASPTRAIAEGSGGGAGGRARVDACGRRRRPRGSLLGSRKRAVRVSRSLPNRPRPTAPPRSNNVSNQSFADLGASRVVV